MLEVEQEKTSHQGKQTNYLIVGLVSILYLRRDDCKYGVPCGESEIVRAEQCRDSHLSHCTTHLVESDERMAQASPSRGLNSYMFIVHKTHSTNPESPPIYVGQTGPRPETTY